MTSSKAEKKTTSPDSVLAIQIEGVTKSYRSPSLKTVPALDGVSLEVKTGEVFGFLGPNGAGKTTLIKILVGIMAPDSGRCLIMGQDTSRREAKLRVGYLPERPYYHDFLTSAEFLRFHGRLVGMEDDAIDARIPKLLEKVDLVRARDQRLRTFSKGMLQRIGFAQALLHDPEVLILDEPMSGLDPVGRREVRDIIVETGSSGKTIFFSTHIVHDIEVICSAVGFINRGKLQGAGNIETLLGRTVKAMEIRFSLPASVETPRHKALKRAKKTLDGWVLDLEATGDDFENEVNHVIEQILDEKGKIRGVVPRKSTLEDLFFREKA